MLGQQDVRFTSTATVSVTVLDGDDLNPVFQKPSYKATVEENANEVISRFLHVNWLFKECDNRAVGTSLKVGEGE